MNDQAEISLNLHEWQRKTLVDDRGAPVPVSLSEPDRNLAEKLSSAGFFQVKDLKSGLEIETTSYVGRLQIGPVLLSIQPKID